MSLRILGTVFCGNSGIYSVRDDSTGEVHDAHLRGTLKKDLIYSTGLSQARRVVQANRRRVSDPIAVGDRVWVDTELGLVDEILPRESMLARLLPLSRKQQVLVSNLDKVLVMVSAGNPPPDLLLLDRFLVMIEAAELTAEIVVNKIDIIDDYNSLLGLFEPYVIAGYPIHFVSVRAGLNLGSVRQSISGRITAFSGPSGVGKSSLLNALQPGLRLRMADEEAVITQSGRHTTTTAELHSLEFAPSTWVADTPGLKQVDFWQLEHGDVAICFPEFRNYVLACQFSNCRHLSEPGCAVKAAVAAGAIADSRYQSYCCVFNELADKQ
jgi:ribosome biogenesis GTPase